jgi:predicted membrane protein
MICSPAIIYIIFSLTQIIVDTIKGLYNTAFLKFIVSILITILLDALCKGGMGIISWVIVFIPFIFMTVIVSILLYIFGLDVATGKLDLKCENQKTNHTGNLIFSSSQKNNQTNSNSPSNSSDPQYESFITN